MSSMLLSRRRSLTALAAGALLPAIPPARAGTACAEGLAILTVGGLIEAPNRGAFNPERDRFFNHNNLSFNKARSFTAGSLSALPHQTVSAINYGIEMLCKGPLLADVLAAASPSAASKTVRLSALDGYGAELPLADVKSQGWILAMESDGQPFAIGNFGPLYSMRPLAPGEKKTEEEARWVHSLYYIELMA